MMSADTALSTRKRKAAGEMLVSATEDEIEEIRYRLGSVIDAVSRGKIRQAQRKGKGRSRRGAELRHGHESASDVRRTFLLDGLRSAITSKMSEHCMLKDFEGQDEAQKLAEEILKLKEDLRDTAIRLTTVRARVARLGTDTCSEKLSRWKASDDRAACDLGAVADKVIASIATDEATEMAADAAVEFSGLEVGVLEPKLSRLIGAIADLPGPLKFILQEQPELVSSLATTVDAVEAAMGIEESNTEALLRKAPPTPLARGRGGRSGDGGGQPPDQARNLARDARAEQLRDGQDRGTSGAASLSEIFS